MPNFPAFGILVLKISILFLLNFGFLVHFRPGRLNKNVIITWPALGLMGISGPSGVLMLPSGLTALGQHQNSLGAENARDPSS